MSVQERFDETIARLRAQARRSTVRVYEPRPMWCDEPASMRRWKTGVLNVAGLAEPRLRFRIGQARGDVHFRRLEITGPNGRTYSRCLVLDSETPRTVSRKARELRKQVDKVLRR